MPRTPLASLPAPLERAPRLAAAVGLEPDGLWVLRDDLVGPGLGGNKVRKLEFLVAEAIAAGADTLVTGGAAQSNHARLTAAAAARAGLRCVLVLAGAEPEGAGEGSVVVDRLLGADLRWVPGARFADMAAAISAAVSDERAAGRVPFEIPLGGATATGCLGYVLAADEITSRLADVDVVVVASSTGGTHAGLAVGLGDHRLVLGVDVGAVPTVVDDVARLALETAALAGRPLPTGQVRIDLERVDGGYGRTGEATAGAIGLAASTEGLVLDPVYSGKAMAGLVAAVAEGSIGPDERVVFVHTGGSPALFSGVGATMMERWT